jgi:hypothetical protein
MTQLESVVEKKVSGWAVEQGILTFKFTPQGQRGWPDRMFIYEGRCAFVEFKAEGEPLRPLQAHRIQLLNDASIPTIWTSRYEESIEFLCRHLHLTSINKTPFGY